MNTYTAANMSNRTSIIYTYRSPWPRRLATACAIGVLLFACVAGYRLLNQGESIGPVAQSAQKHR